MKIIEILNESEDKTAALAELNQKLKLLGAGFVPMPYYEWVKPDPKSKGDFVKKYTKIVERGNRPIVLFNINGTNIPFYISTGEGGKKNVAVGQWYPIFGIGSDGWFNKGTENEINNFYGSPQLKRVADFLNTNIGDIRHLGEKGDAVIQNLDFGYNSAETINFINKDLNPAVHGPRELFYKNLNDTLEKIQGKPQDKKEPQSSTNNIQPSGSVVKDKITLVNKSNNKKLGPLTISASIGRDNVSGISDEHKYVAPRQFDLMKDEKDNTWKLVPNIGAPNKTMIDGKEVTTPTVLKAGMTISVGNPKSGNQKIPLIVQ